MFLEFFTNSYHLKKKNTNVKIEPVSKTHCHGGHITAPCPFPDDNQRHHHHHHRCGVVVIRKIASRKILFWHLVMCSLWQSGSSSFLPRGKKNQRKVICNFRLNLGYVWESLNAITVQGWAGQGIFVGPLWPTSHLSTDGQTVFLSVCVRVCVIDQLGS